MSAGLTNDTCTERERAADDPNSGCLAELSAGTGPTGLVRADGPRWGSELSAGVGAVALVAADGSKLGAGVTPPG